MQLKLTVDFVLIVGILLNALAIIGLVRIKQKRTPQYILLVFWFFILGIIIFFYSKLHELYALAFWTNYIEDAARFFIPPLVYIYVKSIFHEKSNLIRKNLFHFVPFIAYFILYTLPNSMRWDFPVVRFIDQHIEPALVMDIFGILYFSLSLRLFYIVSKTLKHHYSNISNKDFLWLEKFLISFLIVLVVDLLITINEISFGYDVFWDGYITIFFMIIAMGYIGYYGLTQSTVFLPNFLVKDYIGISDDLKKKRPYLNQDQQNSLQERFNELMHTKKPYLQPTLDLKTLAEQMNVSERILSAFFKEVLNGNFYDSINHFRVEEAKEKLKSNNIKNYSITGIGLSSGFSSKSSFFRIFRKKTKLSPLAFREKALKESHEPQ